MNAVDPQRQAQAVRQLFRAVGGLEAAASITGLSTSQLQRCSDPRSHDSLTIRDLFLLEEVAHGTDGFPQVTRLACNNAGGTFSYFEGEAEPQNIHLAMSNMCKEFSDTAAEAAEAAAEGHLSKARAIRILKELQEQIAATAGMEQLLVQAIGAADA